MELPFCNWKRPQNVSSRTWFLCLNGNTLRRNGTIPEPTRAKYGGLEVSAASLGLPVKIEVRAVEFGNRLKRGEILDHQPSVDELYQR